VKRIKCEIEVEVGQVWTDNDRRRADNPRLIKVVRLPGDGTALVTASKDGGITFRGRWTSVRLDRFRPNSTGYRFIRKD